MVTTNKCMQFEVPERSSVYSIKQILETEHSVKVFSTFPDLSLHHDFLSHVSNGQSNYSAHHYSNLFSPSHLRVITMGNLYWKVHCCIRTMTQFPRCWSTLNLVNKWERYCSFASILICILIVLMLNKNRYIDGK